MDHGHKLNRLKEIKNITKKRKSFFEKYNVCQTWYGGKVDTRNKGIGLSLSCFFFLLTTSK